jgi:hypothetical protein
MQARLREVRRACRSGLVGAPARNEIQRPHWCVRAALEYTDRHGECGRRAPYNAPQRRPFLCRKAHKGVTPGSGGPGVAGVWGEDICGFKLSSHADRGNWTKVGGMAKRFRDRSTFGLCFG